MNNEVNAGKSEIDGRVPKLVALVFHGQQRNSPFYDPEDQQTAHEKSHPLAGSLFKRREIFNNAIPHGKKSMGNLRKSGQISERGFVTAIKTTADFFHGNGIIA